MKGFMPIYGKLTRTHIHTESQIHTNPLTITNKHTIIHTYSHRIRGNETGRIQYTFERKTTKMFFVIKMTNHLTTMLKIFCN